LAVPRPREGGLRRGEIFGSALLQPARSVRVSLSAFFIDYVLLTVLLSVNCLQRKWRNCLTPARMRAFPRRMRPRCLGSSSDGFRPMNYCRISPCTSSKASHMACSRKNACQKICPPADNEFSRQCFDTVGWVTGSASLSVLTAIFQVNLGEPLFIEAKDDGGGDGDNWTTGAITRAKIQSNHHHQQTNIQFFLQAGCHSCRPSKCQSTEGKISHSMDLLTPS